VNKQICIIVSRRRRHTRSKRDWSSDVCSSDLAEELELPQDANILLVNDGATVGRTAQARRIVGLDSKEDKELFPIVREAIYDASFRPFIKTTGIVGLDEDFMVRAHITMPEKESNNMYSWLMNFQILNDTYVNS